MQGLELGEELLAPGRGVGIVRVVERRQLVDELVVARRRRALDLLARPAHRQPATPMGASTIARTARPTASRDQRVHDGGCGNPFTVKTMRCLGCTEIGESTYQDPRSSLASRTGIRGPRSSFMSFVRLISMPLSNVP